MSRKSQGISLTTIVVAAIALVVLVVLIILFSNRIGFFNRGIEQCPAKTVKCNPNDCNDLTPQKVIQFEKTSTDSAGKTTTTKELVYCCEKCVKAIT